MQNVWTILLSNVAVIAVFVALWTSVEERIQRRLGDSTTIVFGGLAGATSVALMSVPLELGHGVFVDLRSVPIALAAFFSGPLAAIGAAFAAAVYRIYEGGTGVGAGTLSVVLAAATGTAAHFAWHGAEVKPLRIFYLATLTALGPLLSFFMLPASLWRVMLPDIGGPLAAVVFISTFASGLVLRQELRRREIYRNNEIYRAVIEALPDCLNVKDREGRFIVANLATASMMGAGSAEALAGHTDDDFYPPEIAAMFREDEDIAYQSPLPTTFEQQIIRPDGTIIWLTTMKAPFRDSTGEIVGMVTHNRDITSQKSMELMLAESQNRLSDALANMADGLVMFDRNGKLVFCNEQYRRMFPMTADLRVPGAYFPDILKASEARGERVQIISRAEGALIPAKIENLLKPGTLEIALWDGRWLEARSSHVRDGTLIVFSDITESKRAAELLRELNQQLELTARTDGLTGLANRRSFDETLATEFSRAGRTDGEISLLLIDLDRFKQYNDRYGHPAGDECLKKVAACLRSVCKRSTDVAARYGGEELAAILPNNDEDGALQFADAFRQSIHALGLVHEGNDAGIVTVSIGVATFRPQRGMVAEDVIQAADAALYRAKSEGRDTIRMAGAVAPGDIRVVA